MTIDDVVPTDAPTPARPPRHSGAWVAVLVTLVGSIVIIATIVGAALGGLASGGRQEATYTSAVDGVSAVDIDLSAGNLTTTFADVDEAVLDVQAQGWRSSVDWVLEVRDDVLRVSDQDRTWFWPTFGGGRSTAQLVLPAELEGAIDLGVDVSAGALTVDGDVAAADLQVSAGSLTFTGASSALTVDVSAGDANITTSGPDIVGIEVSAGRVTTTITGEPPSSTTVDVSAGGVVLDLPDGDYALTGDVSAGDRTIDVRTDPGSASSLHVEVSAGSATVGYSD